MITKTEEQIVKNWRYNEPPLVSIMCQTYNHKLYIAGAIEGFLSQQTDFSFEIIIHDDASTDGTPSTIIQYADKYPNIIRPILQTENQNSQHRKNSLLAAIDCARGKYIALCDGDDYWTDENKLQIQIEEMQKNPRCYVSFHPVLRQLADGKGGKKILSKHCSYNKIYHTGEIILGDGGFCPTASLIFKKEIFNVIPDWFLDAPVGDYFLQILASLNGGALYINKVMAVYRANAIGSWSERMLQDENFVYDYFEKLLKSLDDIDSYTHHQYRQEFNFFKKKACFYMCIKPVLSLEKRKRIFEASKSKFDLKTKILWYLLFRNKNLSRIIYNFKKYVFD